MRSIIVSFFLDVAIGLNGYIMPDMEIEKERKERERERKKKIKKKRERERQTFLTA